MLPKLPTIEEAARLMRQKELTPLDLVEHCLVRIAQFEDRIHAWVLVDEEGARKEAKRLTDMLARGEDRGPLHGIPIGIKDIIDVAGWQTKCGSKLRENVAPAEKDATVVANLRKAGAIILGKTVTTEFACFDPPPTRNPWNLNHTPGGSSSGSAAAVAMEMCMAALGTQTGGSIIRPAAYCGACGFKPEFDGDIMAGVFPFTKRLDHVGPLARSVADLAAVHWAYRGLPQFDWRMLTAPIPRLTVCEPFFRDNSAIDVWKLFEAAVKKLKDAGAEIANCELPPEFNRVHEMHRRIMAVEAAMIHRAEFERAPEAYSFHIRTLVEEGLKVTAIEYEDALAHHRRFRERHPQWVQNSIANMDGLLIPATPTPAPATLQTTGDPKFNSPWSYSGTGATTIPIGLSADGLPIGLQILGGFDFAIAIAERCEQILSFSATPLLLTER